MTGAELQYMRQSGQCRKEKNKTRKEKSWVIDIKMTFLKEALVYRCRWCEMIQNVFIVLLLYIMMLADWCDQFSWCLLVHSVLKGHHQGGSCDLRHHKISLGTMRQKDKGCFNGRVSQRWSLALSFCTQAFALNNQWVCLNCLPRSPCSIHDLGTLAHYTLGHRWLNC